VAENYGQPNQCWFDAVAVSRVNEMLEHNKFPVGSMGPKIRAAVTFVVADGKEG